MSVEIAWKQNILVTDFHLLKSLLVVLGFGSQAFVCGFSRQNINSVHFNKYVLFHISNGATIQDRWGIIRIKNPGTFFLSHLHLSTSVKCEFIKSLTIVEKN